MWISSRESRAVQQPQLDPAGMQAGMDTRMLLKVLFRIFHISFLKPVKK